MVHYNERSEYTVLRDGYEVMTLMGYLMAFVFLVYLASSAFLVLVVLVQSGKGGGLSGLVGAGSSLGDTLGATGAEKTLNRWTTYAALGFLCLNILLVAIGGKVYTGNSLGKYAETATVDSTPGDEPEAPGMGMEVPEAPEAPEGTEAPATTATE